MIRDLDRSLRKTIEANSPSTLTLNMSAVRGRRTATCGAPHSLDRILDPSSPRAQYIFIAMVLSFGLFDASPAFCQQDASPVVVAPVVETKVPLGKSFFGTTEPFRRMSIGSAVDGRVEALYFEEGQELLLPDDQTAETATPWDLVKLRTATIVEEVAAAKAELQFREFSLQELKESLPEEIRGAEEAATGAERTYDLAFKKFGRIRSLFERQSGVTPEEFDEASSALDVAKSKREELSAALRRLKSTKETKLSQAQARVDIQAAEVRKLEDQLDKHTIRCPFPGYVISQPVEVGDWVARGDVVAEVIQIDPIECRVFVPESDVLALQKAMKALTDRNLSVQLRFDSLPGEVFTGSVERIVPQADTRSRSFPVLIRIDNPKQPGLGRRLGSGMLGQVQLPVGPAEAQRLVPKDAVVLEDDRATVMVLRQEGSTITAQEVAVKLGISFGSMIAVDGQVKSGDRVVVEGNERIRPGQPLEIQRELPAVKLEKTAVE